MAKKKAGSGDMEATGKKPEQRRGRPPGGPFWHAARGQWVCRLGGRSRYAPKTIGESNVLGARKWYREIAKSEGLEVGGDALPGTETAGGLRKMMVTFTPETAAKLLELDPLVGGEQLSATTNYSRTISVAVHEALARRKGKAKG